MQQPLPPRYPETPSLYLISFIAQLEVQPTYNNYREAALRVRMCGFLFQAWHCE